MPPLTVRCVRRFRPSAVTVGAACQFLRGRPQFGRVSNTCRTPALPAAAEAPDHRSSHHPGCAGGPNEGCRKPYGCVDTAGRAAAVYRRARRQLASVQARTASSCWRPPWLDHQRRLVLIPSSSAPFSHRSGVVPSRCRSYPVFKRRNALLRQCRHRRARMRRPRPARQPALHPVELIADVRSRRPTSRAMVLCPAR